jgi:hypothetical protein
MTDIGNFGPYPAGLVMPLLAELENLLASRAIDMALLTELSQQLLR